MMEKAGPENRGNAMGFIGIGTSAGELAGPILGGLAYERGGHYAVFAVALVVVGTDVILRLLLVEQSKVSEDPAEHEPLLHGDEENIDPIIAKSRKQRPVFFALLGDFDLLASLWAIMVASIMRAGFESVSYATRYYADRH